MRHASPPMIELTVRCYRIASLPALAAALNDLQNMLILQQGAVKKSTNKKDPDAYDKTMYMTYAQDTKSAFGKLYTYCFGLAKQECVFNWSCSRMFTDGLAQRVEEHRYGGKHYAKALCLGACLPLTRRRHLVRSGRYSSPHSTPL
jgi:hypothetical protein